MKITQEKQCRSSLVLETKLSTAAGFFSLLMLRLNASVDASCLLGHRADTSEPDCKTFQDAFPKKNVSRRSNNFPYARKWEAYLREMSLLQNTTLNRHRED